MHENSVNSKRLAKNTLLLYIRMLFMMAVSLYTSRIVLKTLGVEDFGIYNVVGGVVSLFNIVSSALSASVTRFLNIEMGRGNSKRLKEIFSSSVTTHILLTLLVVVLAELLGPWFITSKMTIPEERLEAALWVFQFSIATFSIQLISIPYNACIIAHENMKIFAYISIIEVTLKLVIVYVLLYTLMDKLILYSILMFAVALLIRIIYQIYCRKRYEESRFYWNINKPLIKEMFGFTSWNVIGSTSVILSDHGINILLNIFCNPIVNAARGIAMQVNHAINGFVGNFMVALNPQITKSYGANDLNNYKKLMINGSRFSMSLLTILSLPILIETPYILHVWLGKIPDHTVNFVRLILLFAISEAMSGTFTTGLLSTGKIKKVMLSVAVLRMLNLPISYIVLSYYNVPEFTMILAIIISQINLFIRLFLLKKVIQISIHKYVLNISLRIFFIISITYYLGYLLTLFLHESIFRLIITSTVSLCLSGFLILFILCTQEDRRYIFNLINKSINKYVKKNL